MTSSLKTFGTWAFLFCFLALLFSSGCEGASNRLARAYIRESYYGWVRIEYGVKGAPDLPAVSLFRWHYPFFPSSGLLQTSSELKRDFAGVEIYYGTAMEVRAVPENMIHGRISDLNVTRPDGSRFDKKFETIFIGPANVYEEHRNELERFKKSNDEYVIPKFEDLPRVGNIRR